MDTSSSQAKAATPEGTKPVAEPVAAAAVSQQTPDPAQELLASDPMLAAMVAAASGAEDTAGKPAVSSTPAPAPAAAEAEGAAEETPGEPEAAPAGEEAQAPAEGEEPAEGAEGAPSEGKEGEPKEGEAYVPPARIRTGRFSDTDKQALALIDIGVAPDLETAISIIKAQKGEAAPAPAAKQENGVVEAAQANVDRLEAELAKAGTDFDTEAQNRVYLELRKADRVLAQARERQAATQAHSATYETSVSRAKAEFPEAADQNSLLSGIVRGLFASVDDAAIAQDPDIAFKLTEQAAAQLEKAGIAVKRTSSASAKPPAVSSAPKPVTPPPAPKVEPKKGPVPVPGNAGGRPAPVVKTNPEEEVKAQILNDLGPAYAGMV